MRILLLTNDFPSELQPTRGVFNYQMALALGARHRIEVISPVSWVDARAADPGRRRDAGVRLVEGMRVHHPRYYYTPGVLRPWYGAFLWASISTTVRAVIAESRPDIVLSYWLHPDGDAANRAAKLAGVPSVVMSGGSDVLVIAREPRRRRRIVAVMQTADAVVCVSRHLKAAITTLGIDASRVHVITRGVDRAAFSPGDAARARESLGIRGDRPVLVWVGRMNPVKGLETLIGACERLRKTGTPCRLYLVGDGPLREKLQAQVRRGSIEEDVVFAGRVAHAALPDWYRAADLTVLPSVSEGIPNVLLESIACGTPFVASDVGGVGEIADARLDRLVAPGDPELFAGAIRSALTGRPGGGRALEPHTWAESVATLGELLELLVARLP